MALLWSVVRVLLAKHSGTVAYWIHKNLSTPFLDNPEKQDPDGVFTVTEATTVTGSSATVVQNNANECIIMVHAVSTMMAMMPHATRPRWCLLMTCWVLLMTCRVPFCWKLLLCDLLARHTHRELL